MKKYKVKWDAQFQVDLPEEVGVPDEVLPEDVADYIADMYGWCIDSLKKVSEACDC